MSECKADSAAAGGAGPIEAQLTGANAPAIGIDLGTTYSCVGVWKNNGVEIIANDQGNRTTPSYVAFTDNERLIGEAAKNQCAANPSRTIFDAKRLIGRKFTDSEVQKDMKLWPFTVVEKDSKPIIELQFQQQIKQFTPEQISSFVLTKMKQTAENYLGTQIRDAVITVPAYFNDSQRASTKDAGTIAGLNVLRIINEPTAAAIAYGLGRRQQKGQTFNVMIFDLGGGTFDVSLLTMENGIFEVKATAGHTHLGGEDFDNRLVEHFADEFLKKHGTDIRSNDRSLRRLRTACERAKRQLSTNTQANIEIDSLCDGIDFCSSITRARFEDLCSDYFNATLQPVEQVLRDANMTKEAVNEVVLVGGSTRIPKVQKLIKNYFDKEPCRNINPDEAVAFGAAVQAAILSGNSSDSNLDILLIDVTPLSLGIETDDGLMDVVIPRNTSIPCRKTRMYSTVSDNATCVDVKIFEGERVITQSNALLGCFELSNITPAPRGVPQIEVTFDLDADGILSVSAEEKTAGRVNSNKILISNDKGRLTRDEIEQMINDAQQYASLDELDQQRLHTRSALSSYATSFRNLLSKYADSISPDESKSASEAVEQLINWIEQTPDATQQQLEAAQQQVESVARPIIVNLLQHPTQTSPQGTEQQANTQ